VRVIAAAVGFYKGARRRVGEIFDMAESVMKTDKAGNPVLPKWVREAPATEAEAKALVSAAKTAEDNKQRDGAIAASGGKAAKAKTTETQELV